VHFGGPTAPGTHGADRHVYMCALCVIFIVANTEAYSTVQYSTCVLIPKWRARTFVYPVSFPSVHRHPSQYWMTGCPPPGSSVIFGADRRTASGRPSGKPPLCHGSTVADSWVDMVAVDTGKLYMIVSCLAGGFLVMI